MTPLPLSFRSRALAVLVVGALSLAAAGCGSDDDDGAGAGSASGSGDGGTTTTSMVLGQVQTFDVPSRNHTTEVQDYPQTPPVGGDHADVWQNCGFYSTPIYKETGVHSLEHGAVWITFRADLPADQVSQIQALAQQPYTLASPWDPEDGGELPAPIVFSAWGAQLGLESLPAPEADNFLTTYRQSVSAPEPGAPCTGGIDAVKE